MQSKKSLFNKAIIKNDWKRFWPVMLIEFILCQLFVTLTLVSKYMDMGKEEFTVFKNYGEYWENITSITCSVIPWLASVVVVALLFGYLQKEKEAFAIHTFPIQRKSLYCSHLVTGFWFIFLPLALTIVNCFFVSMSYGVAKPAETLLAVLDCAIVCVFSLALSAALAMVVGNTVLGMIIGVLINLVFMFVDYILHWLQNDFFSYSVQNYLSERFRFTEFSPIYIIGSINMQLTSVHYDDFNLYRSMIVRMFVEFVIVLLVAVVLLWIGYLLYKKREVERAGEMVVFSWAKVVFRVVFSICAGLLITAAINAMLFTVFAKISYNQRIIPIVIILLVSTVVAYLISNMILEKTFFIFKKTSYVRAILMAGICVGLFIVTIPRLTEKSVYKAIAKPENKTAIITITDYTQDTEIEHEDGSVEYNPTCINYEIDSDDFAELSKMIYSVIKARQAKTENEFNDVDYDFYLRILETNPKVVGTKLSITNYYDIGSLNCDKEMKEIIEQYVKKNKLQSVELEDPAEDNDITE